MLKRKRLIKALSYIFLCASTFVMAYPVLFMVLGSFSTNEQFLDNPLLSIPNTLNSQFFSRALERGVWESYLFTLQRVGFYLAVNILVGVIGGYIFSKLRFPGRDRLFLLFLSGMLMPAILMIVPRYLLAAWVPLAGGNNMFGRGGHGFIGNWPVLFLFDWVSPFAIFLCKQSFDMLPTEYEDAARMDGAGKLTVIFRVYGPLLKPPIVALITVTFVGVWNDYLWPVLTIYGHPQWYPITLRIGTVSISGGAGSYPAALIRIFLASWPPAVVYLILQRYLVQGLVASGLKG